ncbi:MAG: dihydroorotase [Ruminococcaceae bacterium]|nr:dihydroorotase [Oscillospiraceae bacterium]
MQIKLKNALCLIDGKFSSRDVYIKGTEASFLPMGEEVLCEFDNCIFSPGFLDVHVHLREPGFSMKERIATGTAAAAKGGYTDVCSMPNLNPVPDSPETLRIQTDIIERDAVIGVHPYGAITKCEAGIELADMEGMSDRICAFSDDGRGVQDDGMMREAMLKAKALGKIIAAHCEDNSLLFGGYINSCAYQRVHGHRGISNESEYKQIERDLKLVRETGCDYHVCHISTKESVELIRKAKAEGLPVTCETGPHYLVLCDENLQEDARFKMNPPLRGREDMMALRRGIIDGTIDMIATDHAPHTLEEKSLGLEKSPMGITGIETAFAIMYTELVEKGVITMEKLLELMVINPRKRFGIDSKEGSFSVLSTNRKYTIDPNTFLSMGKSTPFAGKEVKGECLMTVYNRRLVWQSNMIER